MTIRAKRQTREPLTLFDLVRLAWAWVIANNARLLLDALDVFAFTLIHGFLVLRPHFLDPKESTIRATRYRTNNLERSGRCEIMAAYLALLLFQAASLMYSGAGTRIP